MLRTFRIGFFCAIIAGCASSSPPVREKLDSGTGVTITFSPMPIIFYRDTPAYAANARNFISFGPMQLNRSGSYRYFIWLGIWSTNQTAAENDTHDEFDSIILFVDGEPLALDVSGWTPDAIGASEPVYLQPVASAIDAYYQVTLDQIRLIAEADSISLQTTGFTSRSFELWDKQSQALQGFRNFVRATY